MTKLRLAATSKLDLVPDSYIYSIIPLSKRIGADSFAPLSIGTRLAVLCSDDSVRILNSDTLNQVPDGALKAVNKSVTCVKAFACPDDEVNVVVTTGRDGRVRFWDLRTSKMAMEAVARTERRGPQPLSALEVDALRNCLVGGSELDGDGPGDAPIFVWDSRRLDEAQHLYTESHTDTITELKFHPHHASMLLSASTDGLINLINVADADEDEAVYQVINHESAVHHSGFLDEKTIYGIGTDETLSFYPINDPDVSVTDPDPVVLGDVRETLASEYVVDVVRGGSGTWVAAGRHSSQQLKLVPLQSGGGSTTDEIDWAIVNGMSGLHIDEAHGEDIVRHVYVDGGDEPVVFTCGEDGQVKAWKSAVGSEAMAIDSPSTKSSRRDNLKSKVKEGRFRPY